MPISLLPTVYTIISISNCHSRLDILVLLLPKISVPVFVLFQPATLLSASFPWAIGWHLHLETSRTSRILRKYLSGNFEGCTFCKEHHVNFRRCHFISTFILRSRSNSRTDFYMKQLDYKSSL